MKAIRSRSSRDLVLGYGIPTTMTPLAVASQQGVSFLVAS